MAPAAAAQAEAPVSRLQMAYQLMNLPEEKAKAATVKGNKAKAQRPALIGDVDTPAAKPAEENKGAAMNLARLDGQQ